MEDVARVVLKFRRDKDCKGNDIKQFDTPPQCSNCDAICGFYRDTCPNCGAKLDRSNVERIERKD